MKIFPLESFSENLLPYFPNYHLCRDGSLYSLQWAGNKTWVEKQIKDGGSHVLSTNKGLKRIPLAALVLISHGREYDEEKPILFLDNNKNNLSIENIQQLPYKSDFLRKFPLSSFEENLKEIYPHYSVTENGEVFTRKNRGAKKLENFWRKLKPKISPKGYVTFSLIDKNEKPTTAFLHVLLAHVFFGPRPSGMFVCHNDGNPSNNTISNLRYDTPLANSLDRIKHGTMLYGEACPNSNFKDEEIKSIVKEFIETDITAREITQKYDISYSGLNHILRRKVRKHLPLTEKELEAINLKLSMNAKKLRPNQIIEIFKCKKDGEAMKDIAKKYGVHYQMIYLILKRRIWKNVNIPIELV